jgi:predicted lipid-binding transport protein (Tim44 family)
MRYSIKDATVDASSGRVVSGSESEPQEVTELWTFRRPLNGNARQWELSAIQQAGDGEQVRLAS